jgi:hypothetical protein
MSTEYGNLEAAFLSDVQSLRYDVDQRGANEEPIF